MTSSGRQFDSVSPVHPGRAEHDENAVLLREKESAQAANAAKSRYLATVSHELRAPLNAIYGYAQLLERGGTVEPVEAGRVIRRSAEHLNNLVEGLLDMSLVENGLMRVDSETVRFSAFLDQVASMFRHAAAAKGLHFHDDRSERLPEFVRMDQKRVRQVLINLLANAIKFTVSGAVTFRVRHSGQNVVFEVADTGPGIPPEDRQRIFIPYERGSDSSVNHLPGIGLGLPISDAIVRILGGTLELESELGCGSLFRVRLMLSPVAGPSRGTARPRIIGYEGERRSILIADDDASHVAIVRSLLESLGFDVGVALDGPSALVVASARSFGLAILDISMPGLSGWETADRLRESHGSAMRIIMLSANTLERHRGNAQKPAHDLFLVKPVGLDELVEAIGAQLGLRWIHDDPPPAPDVPPLESVLLPDAARPHAARIRELLKIGHFREIETEIRHLGATGPGAGPLAAKLLDCLDRFDMNAMGAILGQDAS